MVKFLLALHLVFAVFVVGPLVWSAKTAGRGVRKGDGTLTASSARTLRIYAYVSVLVVGAGFALMSQTRHVSLATQGGSEAFGSNLKLSYDKKIAEIGDTWIWLSLLLWAAAIAIVLLDIVPTLERATKLIQAESSVVGLTLRVAVAGGVVGVLFLAIVVLMVYRPGS